MITYKGFTIVESTSYQGVKIYEALRNKNHALASNQSLAKIVAIIDEEAGE